MKSLGIELSDDNKRLPYLYWTPELHKSPVKHHFIAGSSERTAKELSSLLTKIFAVIKTGPEKYCSIKISHTGVNNMWILNPIQYGGHTPYRVFLCCIKTVCSRKMKLSDF